MSLPAPPCCAGPRRRQGGMALTAAAVRHRITAAGNGPKGKTQNTTRSASRGNQVSTKPGAVHPACGQSPARRPARHRRKRPPSPERLTSHRTPVAGAARRLRPPRPLTPGCPNPPEGAPADLVPGSSRPPGVEQERRARPALASLPAHRTGRSGHGQSHDPAASSPQIFGVRACRVDLGVDLV
jgi:hypothetical protein